MIQKPKSLSIAKVVDFQVHSTNDIFSHLISKRLTNLFIPCLEKSWVDAVSDHFDTKTIEGIKRHAKSQDFSARPGQLLEYLIDEQSYLRIILVGLGEAFSKGFRDSNKIYKGNGNNESSAFQYFGGITAKVISTLENKSIQNIAILLNHWNEKQQISFLTGIGLRSYTPLSYKLKDDNKKWSKTIHVFSSLSDKIKSSIKKQQSMIMATHWARDLGNEPGNILFPESFCDCIKQLSKYKVSVTILNEKKLADLGMNSILSVSLGSSKKPRVAIMSWQGRKNNKDVDLCLVGKGVTFDTGGISLKPAAKMEDMKFDMLGAGAVVGAMLSIADQKIPQNVTAIVGLVENMPDGNALKPGDLIKSASGKTIEVQNTDAEGRLVLADLLWYSGNKIKPKYTINLATLTGAIIVSLGHKYAGFFSNDEDIAGKLINASAACSDAVWRMPLHPDYEKQITSKVADIKNIGGMPAGSITAGHFLKHFVCKDDSWIHIDIAGVAWGDQYQSISPEGATGFGVSLLTEFAKQL